MTEQDYAYLASQLLQRCAIVLEPNKQYLVEARLTPLVEKLHLKSLAQLIERLQRPGEQALMAEVVEAMVTTETSFFRDLHPFETLSTVVLPELIRKRAATRRLNIWCAASSSGQEPYSILIILEEHFPELANWQIDFLATDISTTMLERCRQARYSQLEVNRGLPVQLLLKYFRQEGASWILRPALQGRIRFQQLNLAGPWPMLPEMDVIFLRNVMIYFAMNTKREILGKIRRVLRSDGYLVLGGAETTFHLDDGYKRVENLKFGYYQLNHST